MMKMKMEMEVEVVMEILMEVHESLVAYIAAFV
jgi:hypothetical protein